MCFNRVNYALFGIASKKLFLAMDGYVARWSYTRMSSISLGYLTPISTAYVAKYLCVVTCTSLVAQVYRLGPSVFSCTPSSA